MQGNYLQQTTSADDILEDLDIGLQNKQKKKNN